MGRATQSWVGTQSARTILHISLARTNNAPQSEAADLKKWSRKNMLKLDKIHASIHCRAESFPLVPQLSPHTMHNT